MNLLVISREFPPHIIGGISYHLKYLYEELAQRGHDITIFAGNCRTKSKTESVPVTDSITVNWIPYASATCHHIQFPIMLKYFLKSVSVKKYDVVLTHTEIPYSFDIPVIEKIHDAKQEERQYMRRNMPSPTRILDSVINPTRRWVERRSISCADHLIFNSDLTRNMWETHYNFETASDVIYNGVDLQKFHMKDKDTQGEKYLLFIGDSERKGLSIVKRLSEISPYPIYVVGNTDPSAQNTQYLGRISQNELVKYYNSAHATIHPAEFEAFGNVILESLACGTPVIVSGRCGAAEIIDESCGVVTIDLSTGLEKIRDIDAEQCRQRAERYSWAKVAARTENIIQQVS